MGRENTQALGFRLLADGADHALVEVDVPEFHIGHYTQYCNPAVDKLIFQQSKELDTGKRKALVWEVERRLALDVARPIIFHNMRGTCWYPQVKGLVLHTNSIYNNWRFEDVWLDK